MKTHIEAAIQLLQDALASEDLDTIKAKLKNALEEVGEALLSAGGVDTGEDDI